MKVDLPEPFGPEQAEDLAAAHVDVDAGQRAHALEATCAGRARAAARRRRRCRRRRCDGGDCASTSRLRLRRRSTIAVPGDPAEQRRAAVRHGRVGACAARAPEQPLQPRQDAVGHEQDRRDQDRADHRLAGDGVVGGGEAVEQRRDRDRADRRPGPVARAAEHAHQHHRQRHGDREHLAGRHVREEQRVDAAGDARPARTRCASAASL